MTEVSYDIDDSLADLTVTVCLDEDVPIEPQPRPRNFEDDITLFAEQIGPPIRAEDVEFDIDANAQCRNLPIQAASVMELRLNPPAIGSMRNWEYLAMLLGMSMEEIVGLRRVESPVAKLLQNFADFSLRSLIAALKDTNRVDVLISLQPFINSIGNDSLAIGGGDSGLFDNATTTTDSADYGLAGPSSQPVSIPRPQRPFQIPDRFVLVTHHEPQDKSPQSKEIRKYFRSLFASLKASGEKEGTQILDVEECLDAQNLYPTMRRIYSQAQLIILYVSPLYFHEIHNQQQISPPNQKIQLKRYVEDLIGTESVEQGNGRFMVILKSPEDTEYRPLGWARNTLYYVFPNNWKDISNKCFNKV
ncbi:unnamed protein product [Bursaphelenchus xylophilus]|uniref:(pine wood nematode) hypothetical protein n=1 Tax=Bursaphelenchus xylophilus TaxID=6326 RepID=A0A1I7RPC1_BURXY|nr:unnamed protein product [Bursaphelenchus xylophilus]CAG9095767.1 unnamed protein product [Bursaphelenchus xylophilus]